MERQVCQFQTVSTKGFTPPVCVSSVPLRRVAKISLTSKRDSPLGEGGIGANANPEFGALDDDLLPDIAIEHAGALLVHAARSLVDRLEHCSGPISPNAGLWIRLAALD